MFIARKNKMTIIDVAGNFKLNLKSGIKIDHDIKFACSCLRFRMFVG